MIASTPPGGLGDNGRWKSAERSGRLAATRQDREKVLFASPGEDCRQAGEHVAQIGLKLEVDDLARALEGHEILIEPNSPSEGVMVAFVVCAGAPVEFLQFFSR